MTKTTTDLRQALRDRLINVAKRRFKSLMIDGAEYAIQSLTELERSKNELLQFSKSGDLDLSKLPHAKLDLICRCLIDPETKEPLFQVGEWELLQSLPAYVTAKLYSACLEVNGVEDIEVSELVETPSEPADAVGLPHLSVLGIDDPEQWLHECTPRKLAIWQAFYRFEPWGANMEQTANLQTQISGLIAMYASVHGADAKPQQVADFMPADLGRGTQAKGKETEAKSDPGSKGNLPIAFSVRSET